MVDSDVLQGLYSADLILSTLRDVMKKVQLQSDEKSLALASWGRVWPDKNKCRMWIDCAGSNTVGPVYSSSTYALHLSPYRKATTIIQIHIHSVQLQAPNSITTVGSLLLTTTIKLPYHPSYSQQKPPLHRLFLLTKLHIHTGREHNQFTVVV